GQAAALLGENSLAGKLIRGTVGFEQATVKTIMDNAEKKAKQSAFWRSDLEAWCQKTPACFDTAKGSFISPIPDGCCKANYEDWFKTTVTFTTSTEPCATGKFCNNIGYPSASRNYNENTAGQCELPIDPTKHYEGSVSCTPSTQFNPATQVFTDSRCTVLSSDPADFVSQNPDENDNTYWLGKAAALINYGDSYKDSFGASPAACSADYAKGNSQALNTSVYDCMQKNLYCPISFGVDASDNKKKPYCVPPSGTINGLLSSNEGDDVDVANDQIAFAKFSDKGTGTKTDDAWLCEGGRIFAVRDTCVFENCNTYVFANSKNPTKPVLCDASPFCRPDGTQLKETPEGETASLAEGELVKVKRSDSQFGNTPANAQAPFSLFPTAFQRGFTYSIPINTLASTSPSSQVFYNLGLVAPQQCKSGKTGSAYNGQGLFDLQLALVKQASGYSWDSQTLAFSIAQQSYVQVPCEEPLNDGDTQSCQLLFVDSRGSDDACFKSVTQFDFYREKPDSVNWKDSSIPGVSLSEMGYSGRLGEHKGTKTFAITPTGYIVALRDGYKSFQIFDWWKNDGSYGGAFALNWKKKNMLLVAIGAIVVIAGACIAFPVACGQVAPWLSNALAPIVGPLSAALGKVLLLGGLLNSIAPLIALASCGATMAGMAQYYDVWKVQTANVGKDVTVGQGIDEAGNTVVKAAGPDAAGFTNSFKGAQGFCQMVGGLSLALTGAILIGKGLKGDSGCKEAVSTNSKFTVLNGDTWDPQEADARIFGCRGDNWALDDLSTTS
ncbi:MAG TPA: hypothetical protein VJI71_03535, partial [Candidatus Norongarragalinales archaeon]|nr:hypothetical protein [Candidatus Norongarragalinales archaeon]